MHVHVQKFTRTTWPRSSAGPSGSELSQSGALPSEGMCTDAETDAFLLSRYVTRNPVTAASIGSEASSAIDWPPSGGVTSTLVGSIKQHRGALVEVVDLGRDVVQRRLALDQHEDASCVQCAHDGRGDRLVQSGVGEELLEPPVRRDAR